VRSLVLVADADPFELRLLSELCMALGYDVVVAADGGGVLDAVARDRPALVVMDGALARPGGLAVLDIVRRDARLCDLPVVIAIEEGADEARRRALELGATACVTKPYRTAELHARLGAVLGPGAAGAGTRVADSERARESGAPVADAGTAHQLHISLEYEFTRASRYEHPLSCILVRCTGVAASVGHDSLAGILRASVRSVDRLFRLGPGEYAILLPETGAPGCGVVVERLRHAALAARADRASVPDLALGAASFPTDGIASGQALWQAAVAAAEHSRTA
jgi:CheY-like chemotaxis protein